MQSLDRDTVVLNEQDMPKIYWRRHKKPSVNLIDDNPFTIDRQLEDQKYLQEYNKNPHAFAPSKVEKVRSEKIIAKHGASSVLSTKAKVLNKFVREASGVNSYAMIPPVRSKDKASVQEVFDPETHPLVKPYRLESQRKPIMCSFGHRPKSASRTFFPATMKVRLDHNEIAPAGNTGKTGVGLSVAVLAKILHAPKLPYPNQLEDEVEEDLSPSVGDLHMDFDTFDSLDEKVGNVTDMYAALSAVKSNNSTNKSKKGPVRQGSMSSVTSSVLNDISYTSKPAGIIDDRPAWSDNFNIPYNPKEVYALKASGINNVKLPLNERLNRFASRTVAETQINPFCSEKQKNDQIEAATGVPTKVKKSSPVKGVQKYYDPLETQFKNMQKFHHESMKQQAIGKEINNYIANVKEIPQVDYHPGDLTRKLKKNYGKEPHRELTCSVIESVSSSIASVNASSKHPAEHNYSDTSMESLEMKAKLRKKKKRLKSLGGSNSRSNSLSAASESIVFEFEHDVAGSVDSSGITSPTYLVKASTAPSATSMGTLPSVSSVPSDTNKAELPPLSEKKQRKLSYIKTTYSAPVIAMNLSKAREKSRGNSLDVSIASDMDDDPAESDKLKLQQALKSAKKGNTQVLYEHYMKDLDTLNDLEKLENELESHNQSNASLGVSGISCTETACEEEEEEHDDDRPIFNPDY